MTTQGFIATHAREAQFERGLRAFFQFVYVLKGWIEFEYEGQGVVRLEAGSSVYQPPQIRHRELGHSADVELLEIVMPGDFGTSEVDAVQPAAASR
jgi:quercetin dioxygenase-like cupin family protein